MIKNVSFQVAVLLLVMHGVTTGMMHSRKIINGASRLTLHERAFGVCGTSDMYGTELKDREDATLLINQSFERINKSLSSIENKVLLQKLSDDLMTKEQKDKIHNARITSIYQIAQIEAMCKIYAMPGLDHNQRQSLLGHVRYIVKE